MPVPVPVLVLPKPQLLVPVVPEVPPVVVPDVPPQKFEPDVVPVEPNMEVEVPAAPVVDVLVPKFENVSG